MDRPPDAPDAPAATRSSPACPCGLGLTYDDCCGRLHHGDARAATAEQLMRSRFSAFAVGDEAYLLRTWHASTRPRTVGLDPDVVWTRLEILATDRGGLLDTHGTVEFHASFRHGRERGSQHERSRFVKERGDWLYVTGD